MQITGRHSLIKKSAPSQTCPESKTHSAFSSSVNENCVQNNDSQTVTIHTIIFNLLYLRSQNVDQELSKRESYLILIFIVIIYTKHKICHLVFNCTVQC